MKVITTALPGVLVIEPDVHRDPRGWFLETYHHKRYSQAGIPDHFLQDNHSRSSRDTLRGLHAQIKHPQGKLLRVSEGEIFDVTVDIRRGSPTYKRWYGVVLSAENFRQLYVPAGFAHGFCVQSDIADVLYKCTDYYDPPDELHLIWNDPDIGVKWPVKQPVLSVKDTAGVRLRDIEPELPVYQK